MVIEEALKAYLEADATLVGLIGVRLYPNTLPQDLKTWPALVYRQTGSDGATYLGAADGRSTLERDTFELEARSPALTQAAAVRDRLRVLFNGAGCAGMWGGASGLRVRGAIFKDVFATEDPRVTGENRVDRGLKCQVTIIWVRG